MNYIVMDLEWNQSNTGLEEEVARLPFEIIEIGAIKLNDKCVMLSEFNELIKPQVYQEMHRITSKLIHLQMKELQRGRHFDVVCNEFMDWVGEEPYYFCTWGNSDITELQRNMAFFNVKSLGNGPVKFLDVQKLYALIRDEDRNRKSLETAVDEMNIEKDIPFHRAFSDAYYTAKILKRILDVRPDIIKYVSFDTYYPPVDKDSEIKADFGNYVKYITRCFEDKTEAMADKEVASSKCFLCHRNLRKKIKWFTVNGKHYYCVAYCEKHGYLKGKIRFHKTSDERVFVVKTMKLTNEEEVLSLAKRSEKAKEYHKKHR